MISPYIYPGLPTIEARREAISEAYDSDFELIWNITCKHLHTDPALRTNYKCRKQELVLARYIAMYFMAMKPVHGISKSQYYRIIGNWFGKDRTTMLHGLKVLGNMMQVYGEKWKYKPVMEAIADELSSIWETRNYYVQRTQL